MSHRQCCLRQTRHRVVRVDPKESVDEQGSKLEPYRDFRRIVNGNDRMGRIIYADLLRFLVNRQRAKDKELDLVMFVEEDS